MRAAGVARTLHAGWLALACALPVAASGQARPEEAATLAARLSLQEQLGLLRTEMVIPGQAGVGALPPGAIAGAGFAQGIPRLGIPPIRETDAELGVAWIGGARHAGATAFASGAALAAGFDPGMAQAVGAAIGQEARRSGFNVLLGGAVNLVRDPRGGRSFEYLGEDPLLAGTLAAAEIRGTQAQGVVSTVKHLALNDQETLRQSLDVRIGEAAARESDLLAFELAIEGGHPGAVMCAYSSLWGVPACANRHLLTDILKTDWRFPGWVMSDWGAVPDVSAALAGLDQESGAQLDGRVWFGEPLAARARASAAWSARVRDMAARVLTGLALGEALHRMPGPAPIDNAADTATISDAAGAATAQREEEQGIVLLANPRGVLPLGGGVRAIALIGGNAADGVLSGGGSSQVAPAGGPAAQDDLGGLGPLAFFRKEFFLPPSPASALAAALPGVRLSYDDGRYPKAAAEAARRADVAIVFATQWSSEGEDLPDLSLPGGQDALISAVAAANPRTVVVLETNGAVLMPWRDGVAAILEAWYPGAGGAAALAGVLTGRVDPSGRLPVTFPRGVSQLPRPAIPGEGAPPGTRATVTYSEGADVGYRWFARRGETPLFPFGFGLGYTRFSLGDLRLTGGARVTATFSVRNTGARDGTDTPQLYLSATAAGPRMRLLGWVRVTLRAGEARIVRIAADPRLLADWDEAAHGWQVTAGPVRVAVGEAAGDAALRGEVAVQGRLLPP